MTRNATTFSNRVMDINPEDIETLSVLKGAAAGVSQEPSSSPTTRLRLSQATHTASTLTSGATPYGGIAQPMPSMKATSSNFFS